MPDPNFYMKHLIGCGSDEGEACDCGMMKAIEYLIDLRDDKKRLEAERDKLLDALTPFVEVWEKRSGPNQPSISSEMLVAVHVKHFIHAKTLVRPECLADVLPTPTGSGEW